jgi:hypothetical protein
MLEASRGLVETDEWAPEDSSSQASARAGEISVEPVDRFAAVIDGDHPIM